MRDAPYIDKKISVFFFLFAKNILPHKNNFFANRIQLNQYLNILWILRIFKVLTKLWYILCFGLNVY